MTWVALVGGQGDALYRTVIQSGGLMSVAIELGPRDGGGSRALCRDQCRLPSGTEEIDETMRRLLSRADERAAQLLHAMAQRTASRAADRATAWPGSGIPDPEHRVRERAYFLWEREGRPDGRALEFWVRARREEETQAA